MDTNNGKKSEGYFRSDIKQGSHCVISHTAAIGKDVIIGHNCIIEDNVQIGEGTYIDSNTIIRFGTTIGEHSLIGSNCIIGEYQNRYTMGDGRDGCKLCIGKNSLIRSGSIVYTNSEIGENFQTGHQVTIRERSKIGNNVSIGTLSDIQGLCQIGNYVRLHSNVHVGQHSVIDDYVWVFPYVVFTNDPTPPSENLKGVHVHSFAVVSTGAILLPGIDVGKDALIGAGAIVTKNVKEYKVVVGNPAKEVSDVRNITNKVTGEPAYPWRYHFGRNMPWEGSTYDKWNETILIAERFSSSNEGAKNVRVYEEEATVNNEGQNGGVL